MQSVFNALNFTKRIVRKNTIHVIEVTVNLTIKTILGK